MVAKLYFLGRALLFMAVAIAAAITAGPVRAQNKAIGKLFLNGGSCSASVISPNNDIVTAAHCCWDRSKNSWIGGWSFAPAYNNGNAPYGVFNWVSATVLTSWVNNGDTPSDVCVIKLQSDEAGHPVTYYTGWLGRAWNRSPVQNMNAFGYPGNIGGANNLESCAAKSSAQTASCGPGVLNMACNMTYGSSGGPWIMNYGTTNQVNATVHFYSTACGAPFGKVFNGPQFTSSNIVPVCNAEGC
jgi:V8-like Glu-specific endopeptidase